MERHDTPAGGPGARRSAPHVDGPLGSSGAAPAQPAPAAADPTPPAPEPAAQAPTLSAASPGEREPEALATERSPGAATAEPERDAPAAAEPERDASAAQPEPNSPGGGDPATAGAEPATARLDADKAVVTVGSASGGRVTRVLRRANPVRAARTAGRTTSAWARRPAGRLILPAIIAVLLLVAAGTAGAYLVPRALRAGAAPSVSPAFPVDGLPAAAPAASGPVLPNHPPGSGAPSVPAGSGAPVLPGAGGRPADALAGWAQQVGTRVGIPVVAVEAYGYAELVLARTAPACHLSWTTVAAIGSVESAHGSANGSVLGADGSVQPPIYGLPLDGKGGRQLIRDTDQGTIDGDRTYDRAVGPMQFIPSTWVANAIDADNNGVKDPNDIDDAALTAAAYLCRNGRDLSKADVWYEAILSYNAIAPYAQKVFQTANEYGERSRV